MSKNKRYIYALFSHLSLYFICLHTQFLYSQTPRTDSRINSDNIMGHTSILGSDMFQGRGTGTSGETKAAEYISANLAKFGIIPIGDRKTFYQNIPMHGSVPQSSCELILSDNVSNTVLELGRDYLLYETGAETYIANPIPLVFVGYGIIAPEFDYNDYLRVNVQNKVVVFLEGEPQSEDLNFFNGSKSTIYSYPESKQRIAISRGAKGSIMIPMQDDTVNFDWKDWVQEFAFEHVTLAYSVSSHMSALFNPELADYLFSNAVYDYEQVMSMHEQGKISSFELNLKISFNGVFEERDFIGRNVVGMIKGRNHEIEDTYIIISAHYDHLGIGPSVNGDSIYNGVLDNALGVAALLEIGRSFSALNVKPKRSLLFLFLTGEEKGLLGSTYYADHPVRPLYKTVAAVNIDGIAAFDEFYDIIGVGSELSTLGRDLITVSNLSGLKVSTIPPDYFYESESVNRSDQFSFIKAGIPAILLTEGLHYKNTTYSAGIDRLIQWTKNIYHTPLDDLNQEINYRAANQHTQLIFDFLLFVANKTEPPRWNPGSPYINAQLQSIAEKR